MSKQIPDAEWNGEPTPCFVGTVICGKSPAPTWWCADMEGQRLPCVKVEYYGHIHYLLNDKGQGEFKVTNGGDPGLGHSSIPVDDPLTFE